MQPSDLKKKTISGMFWKFGERICAQLISLSITIVLARLLMPEDYAVISIITIFFSFANVFISGGFNSALIQKSDSDIEDYSSVLWISLIIATIIYIILFFCAPIIAKVYNYDILVSVIRVMGLTLFINAIKSIVCAYISNHMIFKKYFWATLIGTIISGIVGISMAYSGFGCWALVAQQMTNALIDTLLLFITTKVKFVFKINTQKAKKLFKFGSKILVASSISVLYEEINPLIIGIKFSGADLAYYSKGKHYPSMFNSTICDTLSAVLFPAVSKLQGDKQAILNYLRRYMSVSSFIIFPVMLGFLAISNNFVIILFTEKWISSVIYIQIFCVVFMFNIIQVGNLQVIRALGRSDIYLKLEIIKKTAYFAVILVFVLFTNDPIFLALSCVINTFIASIVNTAPNTKLINYKYRLQIIDVGLNLITSICMCIIVLLIGFININIYLELFVQIFIGIIFYVTINLIIKNPNMFYLLNTIKSFLRKKKGEKVNTNN